MLELIVIVALLLIIIAMCNKKKKAVAAGSCGHQKDISAMPQNYDYNNFLYANGLAPETFESHKKYVEDTYSNALLLGSSKDIVRDDTNDINPVLGMRRADYNVHIGIGARQVPTEYRDQLPDRAPPQFV